MENQNQQQQTLEPTWNFESDDDKEQGIETKRYDNGQLMKRVKLSDGRIAEAKRLKGKDANAVRRLTNGEEGKYTEAIVALSVTLDGNKILLEELSNIWYDDYQRLIQISQINFPIAPTA